MADVTGAGSVSQNVRQHFAHEQAFPSGGAWLAGFRLFRLRCVGVPLRPGSLLPQATSVLDAWFSGFFLHCRASVEFLCGPQSMVVALAGAISKVWIMHGCILWCFVCPRRVFHFLLDHSLRSSTGTMKFRMANKSLEATADNASGLS
jgi:hypothetical protein